MQDKETAARYRAGDVLTRLFMFSIYAFTAASMASAQIAGPPRPRDDEAPPRFGAPAEEMRYKANVRHEEESHREMLDRAEEAARISRELRSAFDSHKSLAGTDLKKVERVEKLARKVRERAGGGDDDTELEQTPATLETALTRLTETSEGLLKAVRKTSRHVVSASAIQLSNELIELARHIRASIKQ